LDLKFHDIPNSVALAVREATKRGVWMLTLHIAGGPAMMTAAEEEARGYAEDTAPLLMGVSVLTSLDQHVLTDHLGVARRLEDHMVYLSNLAIECGLDGVVCSAQEVKAVRSAIGHNGIIVTPGIRPPQGDVHDQKRVGTALQALEDGADYLVIGRALTNCADVEATLAGLGLQPASAH
jgi:orotidine-5'-phosphate decarboxylase